MDSSRENAPETGKRKRRERQPFPVKHFGEYLVQGLMIFISVSLGFLSQNIRENINGRQKEEHYIKSYLRNLAVDSAELKGAIEKNLNKLHILDSLMMLSGYDLSNNVYRLKFHRYCFSIVSYYAIFRSNDATFLQLTNSDGLRTIKKKYVADSISKYAAEVKDVYASEALYEKATDAATEVAHEILNYSCLYDTSLVRNKQLTGKFIPFINNDPVKLKLFFNKIYFEIAATETYLRDLKTMQPFLSEFTEYLKKEYPSTLEAN